MLKYKIRLLLLLFLVVSVSVAAQIDSLNSKTIAQKTSLNSNSIAPVGFENPSNVSKEAYEAMSALEKQAFKKAFLAMLKSGTCSHICETYQGIGGTSQCEISNCPKGTKPVCRCSDGGSECGCETYAHGAISLKYAIEKKKSGSVILTAHSLPSKAVKQFKNSTLPNAKKIMKVFDKERLFKLGNKKVLRLTVNDFSRIESKFQDLVFDYSFEDYFELEYNY